MFMVKYISAKGFQQKHFLLLNIRISANLQSCCVIPNSNKSKVIRCNQVQCLEKQRNALTANFTAINTLGT